MRIVGSINPGAAGEQGEPNVNRLMKKLVAAAAPVVPTVSLVSGIAANRADALVPNQTTETGVVNVLKGDINSFWYTAFRSWGVTYSAPTYIQYSSGRV